MISFTPTIAQLKMLASVRGNLWLVMEDKAVELALAGLELSERVGKKESFWTDEDLEDFYTVRKKAFIDGDKIAHIEVRGAMMWDCPSIHERAGLAIRYKTIMDETTAAVNSGAKGVIYRITSPGGTVSGNAEASESVMNLEIPTVAFCEGLACSAAYKLASSTNAIVASKSALMGNIGTILSWTDCTAFWQRWGVEMKAITSEGADLKSTFHLDPNAEQLAFLQESVNEAGKQFRDHVKIGRNAAGAELDPEVWRAGWYSGERAEAMGLIDDIGDHETARQILLSMI